MLAAGPESHIEGTKHKPIQIDYSNIHQKYQARETKTSKNSRWKDKRVGRSYVSSSYTWPQIDLEPTFKQDKKENPIRIYFCQTYLQKDMGAETKDDVFAIHLDG